MVTPNRLKTALFKRMRWRSTPADEGDQTPIDPQWYEAMYQRLKEGSVILCLTLALFVLVALVSHNPEDSQLLASRSLEEGSNAGGYIGAWIAYLLLSLFGVISYGLPPAIAYAAYLIHHSRPEHNPEEHRASKTLWALRGIGLLLSLSTACALSTVFVALPQFPVSSGGFVGLSLATHMVQAFSTTGATLVLLAFWLTGITLFTGLSWVALSQRAAHQARKHAQRQAEHARARWQAHKARQEAQSFHALPPPQERVLEAPVGRLEVEEGAGAEDDLGAPGPPSAATPAHRSLKALQKIRGLMKKTPPSEAPTTPPLSADVQWSDVSALPALGLLEASGVDEAMMKPEELQDMSSLVEARLLEFGIEAQVVASHPGPVITRFELLLAPGIKVNRITSLVKDLARSLSVISVRVVEVIPGKPTVGLEIPNKKRAMVRLQTILSSATYQDAMSPLTLGLGKDIAGRSITVDLSKMPHLLVAGTTGSGKSVGLNAMLLSILYKATPHHVRLIMIDPKMLELAIYEGIPHLLTPVVTDMKDAANALRWCVGEMERRYQIMAALGVRHLGSYNQKVREAHAAGQPLTDPLWPTGTGTPAPLLAHMPLIVVVVDEFADLMMVVGKKVEELIARIAQKARAAGIHLILATQRPSVDVITGLIKANIPTRISYQVSSKIDSRTILDQSGAEQLLGHGDMLYLPPGSGMPVRIHGAYVADEEVHRVVKAWRAQGKPDYIQGITQAPSALHGEGGDEEEEYDELYDDAVHVVVESRRASISQVQRRLRIGYNRAARMVERMERDGVVGPLQSNGMREVLAPPAKEVSE